MRLAFAEPPLGACLLAVLNLLVFAWEASYAGSREIDAFAAVPYNVLNGGVRGSPGPPLAMLTLISALFEHANARHLAINLTFFAAFAPAVERLLGTASFLGCYLVCGVVGTLAQIALDPASREPILGASGAVAGILGVHLARLPTKGVCGTSVPAVVAVTAWLAVQATASLPDVASASHLGGFAAGAFLGEMMRE